MIAPAFLATKIGDIIVAGRGRERERGKMNDMRVIFSDFCAIEFSLLLACRCRCCLLFRFNFSLLCRHSQISFSHSLTLRSHLLSSTCRIQGKSHTNAQSKANKLEASCCGGFCFDGIAKLSTTNAKLSMARSKLSITSAKLRISELN